MSLRKPNVVPAIVIALTILFVLGSLYRPALFDPIDLKLYDAATSLAPEGTRVGSRVVLIEIDRRSLKALGPWPWPRQLLGDMLTILRNQGARAIGLLVPLSEREDNRALKGFRALREKFDAHSFSKKDEGLRDWVLERLREAEENLDSDRVLVEKTREARNVVLPVFIQEGEASRPDPANERVLKKSAIGDAGPALPRMEGPRCGFVLPFPEIADAALGLGHAGLSARGGMEGRSHRPFVECQGGLLPSFSLRAAMALLGVNPKQAILERSRLRIGDLSIPLWEGEVLVPFRKTAGPERQSFSEVLQGGKVPVSLEGKCVLIGFNLEESKKIDTPLSPAMPALEFHARTIDSILAKDFVKRPQAMIYMEAGAMAGIGLAAAFLLVGIPHGIRFAGTFALLAVLFGTGYVLLLQGVWARTGAPALFVVVLSLTLTFARLIRDARAGGAADTHRLLGIGFQRGGLLDQAFAEFRLLPLGKESKDLLYQLGMEYEKRGLNDQALNVYEHLNRHGQFRDAAERVRTLREVGFSSEESGLQMGEEDQSVPEEPPVGEARTYVGRYKIIQELGKGSMGLVYKALDPKLDRTLAVKTIRFSDEFDPEVIQEIKSRFLREAEIAGRLSHPGIVTVYDVGEDHDLTYIAMELLEGEDLEKHITPATLLPLRRVLEVVASVADALDFAHKSGVIHRDIKAANIMLLRHGGVKVTDFGIAKAVSSTRTRTGVILGTPNYMSPEQIMGQRIDYRSDIFSLGVLFFQLLTGELPFRADNLSSLLNQITQVRHPAVREKNPRVPKVCEQLLDKALAKSPDHRFVSAGEFGKLVRMVISKMDQLRK